MKCDYTFQEWWTKLQTQVGLFLKQLLTYKINLTSNDVDAFTSSTACCDLDLWHQESNQWD